MELEKQIEILIEWHKGAEMSLPIMSSADIERFLHWLEDYKQLKADYIYLDRQLRNANSRADARWISVKDAMPKDDEYVICLTMNGDFRIMVFDTDDERWYEGVTSYRSRCVTHWMPIPEPPKE